MQHHQRGFVWLPLLLAVLGILVVSGGAYFLNAKSSYPAAAISEQIQANAPSSTLLATFVFPNAGDKVSVSPTPVVRWSVPSAVQTKFKDFWIVLNLIDSSGKQIGSIGDGYKISDTSAKWDILTYLSGGFYPAGLYAGESYRIQATLQGGSKSLGCDPAMPAGPKACVPLYSPETQELMKEAQNYTSGSGWFTFGGLPPEATNTPIISIIYTDQAPTPSEFVGREVVIQGSGFTHQDNTVHFGSGGAKHVPSYGNGKNISYTIPASISPCDLVDDSTSSRCAAPSEEVTPGTYDLYISNANGQSEPVKFTVVGSTI